MKKETKECRYCKATINKHATVCPNCKRGQFEFIRYILAIIILIVVGILIIKLYDEVMEDEEPKISNCDNLDSMSIVQLYEKNEENEIYAKENYVGKAYIFSGKVHDVELKNKVDVWEEYVGADVTFQNSNDISNLKKDDVIRFCAVVDDFGFFGNVYLKDAIMIK